MGGHRRLLAAVVAIGALVALPVAARGDDPHSCGWVLRVSGDQANVAYPDAAAKYWVAVVPIPPGGRIDIAGRFPHARYISFITYTAATMAIDGIADAEIVPNKGSTNPFVPGANRRAKKRSYAVHVVDEALPAKGRAPNTLYNSNADGSKANHGVAVMVYRLYEPDRGRSITGDVALPSLATVTSDGTSTAIPECPGLALPDLGLTETLAAAGQGGQQPVNTGLGGRNPPRWTRYINAANGVAGSVTNNEQTGDTLYPPLDQATAMLPSGGLYENVHNAYITSSFSSTYGNVLVFKGRAPTTPQTRAGQRRMGTGQLRYWSLCTNTAFTSYLACKQDDQIPLDRSGDYTIVLSRQADRPKHATNKCGNAWLPVGPLPQSILILRNMLPAPSFAQAVQRAAHGSEQQTLGAYYPRGTYYASSADADKALACAKP